MRAIITKQNEDKSFDECGMNNRRVTKSYKSVATLLKYGLPKFWKSSTVRVEFFLGESILGKPFDTIITNRVY